MTRRNFERPFADPASIRRLQACLAGGMLKRRIAERFGCDPDTVDRAIEQLGLKRQMRKREEARR